MLQIIFLLVLVPSLASASNIIVDIGHTTEAYGAVGCSGTPEYEYNKKLAFSVGSFLQEKGKTVSFTGERSTVQTLHSRVVDAMGSAVFLSIHHDSVQPQFIKKNPQTGGNCSNRASGFSIFVSSKSPEYLKSYNYALKLGKALLKSGYRPTLHHAEKIKGESRRVLSKELGIYDFSELYVLKNNPVPALLLEAAVIVNPTDELLVHSPRFQRDISEAVLEMLAD